MKVKELLDMFKGDDPEREVLFSCDEEGNAFMTDAEVSEIEGDDGNFALAIFPLSTSTKED